MNVLIVDDDMATVEDIKETVDWLKLGIHHVYTAYNVSGAKKMIKANSIDIIISDIEMPKENGLDLLKWVRKEKLDYEFLFLTCHESFTYATDAIHYHAAAYLTKPFDINIMEMTLHKIIDKLIMERNIKKSSEYGVWMEKNLKLMKVDFWENLLDENFNDREHMIHEMQERHLGIDTEATYILIFSKISNIESDVARYGKSVFEFILEGFHSELLLGKVENESVVKRYNDNTLNFLTISDNKNLEQMKEKCNTLISTCNRYFKGTITCCIGNPCKIWELPSAMKKLEQLFAYNISCFGQVFMEYEAEMPKDNQIQIINLNKLVNHVENKEKPQILHYLKNIFDELTTYKNLNKHSLYLMQQEIIQVVYADLMKAGIQATLLFHDEMSIRMADEAVRSTVDMVRWVNYLLSKTFEYEDEIAKSATIIDKINDFIHENYMKDITRNEIAAEFYLTPSYIAKLYKRKTGNNIKDYINDYRIKKAKELLKIGACNVSDVAEKVGFDNYSYFSTLFKKSAGVSPKDYRNF